MKHRPRDFGDRPFVFAALARVSCSICAPRSMSKEEVEAFAAKEVPDAMGEWKAVDKSKIGLGGPSPGPCNIEARRLHWFLLDSLNELFNLEGS
jgi:hypothetical protein